MTAIHWARYPQVAALPAACTWLTIQSDLGLASTTIEAYGRALQDYLTFCRTQQIVPETATRAHIAAYVSNLTARPHRRGPNVIHLASGAGLANATIQQRLVTVRLFYDYLVEEGQREMNPVGRGRDTAGKGFGGMRAKGLVPRFTKLPWIPTEAQWQEILRVARTEPIRNRMMLALAYDAGLRREELCTVRSDDLDPAHRMVRIRAETTKGRRERVVPYSTATAVLLHASLAHRRTLSVARGLLFLSESHRNRAVPITLWTWSKVIRRIALRANVPQFSTHTLRHLCLTDLARAGWELHALATFAGHRNLATTLQYIHLSGRDLAEKLTHGMAQIHLWCAQTLAESPKRGRAPVMATFQATAQNRPLHDPSWWQWPIDLTCYDRTPTLTPAEHAALVTLGWEVRRGRGHDLQRPEWGTIARLVRPLDDARQSVFTPDNPYHQRSALDAVGLILHACATTQQAFWAWRPVRWIDAVLTASQQAFQRAYPGWIDGAVRPYLVAMAYLLDGFAAFELLGPFNRLALAHRVFGPAHVQQAVDPILTTLRTWGYHSARHTAAIPGLVSALLLYNRSPHLADLTAAVIERFRREDVACPHKGSALYGIHRAIAALGFVEPPARAIGARRQQVEGVDLVWLDWVERWTVTSSLTPKVRPTFRTILWKVGRWLREQHPTVREPGHWTRDLCAAYIAQVERMHIGQYVQRQAPLTSRLGRPLSAQIKAGYIVAVRTFFQDCQEWEWIPRRFDPARALATLRSIRALTGPNPRVIADDVWAKLLWAGLNLEAQDLPANVGGQFHPLELVRALALVWLFAGLRSDELVRLRLGCIRWQRQEGSDPVSAQETVSQDAICLLDVPTHKTGSAFTKPVDPLVGRAIAAWETIRPVQPPLLDRRTGESVLFLFCYRARHVAKAYLNHGLLPALCRKAGVPLDDARGRITSHRARATIARQLYNAKEPMTLFELQAWLGHRSPETTQYYARITPTTLAKAYTDADYFARNVRTIEVLIDREVVEQGAAASGTPWQYFDLGHGYCTYSFFEQCPHRMACARCDFYVPKGSTTSQLLEAKGNLQRMLTAMPLTEEERGAVEEGAEAVDRLLARLADVPTPTGQTPRQLAQQSLPVIQEGTS